MHILTSVFHPLIDEMELVQVDNDVHTYDVPCSMEVEQLPVISIQSDNYTNNPTYDNVPQGQQESKVGRRENQEVADKR